MTRAYLRSPWEVTGMLSRPRHIHSAGLCPSSSHGGGGVRPSHLRGQAWCLLGPGACPGRPLGPIQQVGRRRAWVPVGHRCMFPLHLTSEGSQRQSPRDTGVPPPSGENSERGGLMHLGTSVGTRQLLVGGLRAHARPETTPPPYFQWHWGGDIQCLPVDDWDGVIGTWNLVGIFSKNRSVRVKAT